MWQMFASLFQRLSIGSKLQALSDQLPRKVRCAEAERFWSIYLSERREQRPTSRTFESYAYRSGMVQ